LPLGCVVVAVLVFVAIKGQPPEEEDAEEVGSVVLLVLLLTAIKGQPPEDDASVLLQEDVEEEVCAVVVVAAADLVAIKGQPPAAVVSVVSDAFAFVERVVESTAETTSVLLLPAS